MSLVDLRVNQLWENVIQSCTSVLRNAELYGFQFMHIPDPDVHQIAKSFDTVVIPMLDAICQNYTFSPESGIKIANIRTYSLHLRAITNAIHASNEEDFYRCVDLLLSEPLLG